MQESDVKDFQIRSVTLEDEASLVPWSLWIVPAVVLKLWELKGFFTLPLDPGLVSLLLWFCQLSLVPFSLTMLSRHEVHSFNGRSAVAYPRKE
jgi:hypothetical protein